MTREEWVNLTITRLKAVAVCETMYGQNKTRAQQDILAAVYAQAMTAIYEDFKETKETE